MSATWTIDIRRDRFSMAVPGHRTVNRTRSDIVPRTCNHGKRGRISKQCTWLFSVSQSHSAGAPFEASPERGAWQPIVDAHATSTIPSCACDFNRRPARALERDWTSGESPLLVASTEVS
ncbi:hypothetical protein MTO96_022185 [Rhipicephalus appendiculatus]